jgi:hypothetical protein
MYSFITAMANERHLALLAELYRSGLADEFDAMINPWNERPSDGNDSVSVNQIKDIDPEDVPAFVLRHLVAPFTPVLDVSQTCFDQSMAYITYLTGTAVNWPKLTWAQESEKLTNVKLLHTLTTTDQASFVPPSTFAVFDASGKLPPDGMYADSQHLCSLLDYTVHENACDLIDLGLANFTTDQVNFIVPRGNTIAMGGFEVNERWHLTRIHILCHAVLKCFFSSAELHRPESGAIAAGPIAVG